MKKWQPVPTLLCRMWGHAWEPEGAEFYSVYRCVRCYHEGYTAGSVRERISLWAWIWRNHIRDWWRDARDWLQCEYCHHRFGRHDDGIDHLPF